MIETIFLFKILSLSLSLFFMCGVFNGVTAYSEDMTVPTAESGSPRKTIVAARTNTPITLDGLLTEIVWEDAVSVSGFIQQEPSAGKPATEDTEVRILYDTENLYIGAICHDSEPDRIIHKEMRYDGALINDDHFEFVLDTFDDKRSGYFFMINPNGARLDGTIETSGFGTNINENWDGIWDARARITDKCWSVEIVIPFKTLRFPGNDIQNWGINFKRDILRKSEETLWTSWLRNDGLFQLSKTGRLTGMEGINRGKKVEIIPYVLDGVEKNQTMPVAHEVKYGVDLKYPLTSDLTLDLTTLTDYAQVESDRAEINLSRYDITYPEKRDFFLEGSEIFQFASETTTPFYSRRIGIASDTLMVPIIGGAKITGKAGKYSLGMLDIQTDNDGNQPSTNYSVIRFKRDLFKKSYIGFIGTNLYDTTDHSNQAVGTDFSYKTDTFLGDKNMSVGGYVAMSNTPGDTRGGAGRCYFDYPNDLLNVFLLYHARGNRYNPEIGFVNMPGVRQYMASVNLKPRPGIAGIRKMHFCPFDFNYYTDMTGRLVSRTMRLIPFGFETSSEDIVEFYISNMYEYLDTDFNIFKNVYIPQGIYNFWYCEGTVNLNESRPFSMRFHTHWGDFYSGSRNLYDTTFSIRFNEYFSLSSIIEYNTISVEGSHFETRDYSLRFNTNLSPRLDARTFIQWNNESGLANLNFRIHFIPRIGSDIYFVYNHLFDGNSNYDTLYNTGIVKIAYDFSF